MNGRRPGQPEDLASFLAGPAYVDGPPEWLLPALSGRIDAGDGQIVTVADFFVPLGHGLNACLASILLPVSHRRRYRHAAQRTGATLPIASKMA